jgi:hypothetical protein
VAPFKIAKVAILSRKVTYVKGICVGSKSPTITHNGNHSSKHRPKVLFIHSLLNEIVK